MLKKHSQFFVGLLFICDMVVVSIAWLAAYVVRFHWTVFTNIVPVTKEIPAREPYLAVMPLLILIWAFVFRQMGMYRAQRLARRSQELKNIVSATTVALILFMGYSFLVRPWEWSRAVVLVFFPLSILGVFFSRLGIRETLRTMRRRGYNLRHVLVVGAGPLAMEVIDRIRLHPETGLNILGMLARSEEKVGKVIRGVKVLGLYEDVLEVLATYGVDQVIVAMPMDAHDRMKNLLALMGNEMVELKIVPDLYQFISLRGGIEDFDGMPVISLLDTPLYGWNRILKRAFDVVASFLLLIFASPFLLLVALAVKLSSPGPILFRQERMGLDGRTFTMYKFRTMRVDAEKETGPVWARPGDPRRTWLGSFLRRWSLDEWPQLFNVLRGDMSLVGPRPERPVFIEQFKGKIPKYMLRHKMQAGMTGWAQVNGWRGNTSLEKRIECDLYYIENWSLALDLKILGITLWRGLLDRNAY